MESSTGPSEPRSTPQRKRPYPPVYFVAAIVGMALLREFAPGPLWLAGSARYLGWIPAILGILLATAGRRLFTRAGTTVKPFQDSSALVTAGVYRFTRNPMYLGMVLVLLGIGIYLGALAPFALVPLFILVLQTRFIRREEAHLTRQFGEEYTSYQKRVRRWI